MKILVIGSGGREHAIIKSIKRNNRVKKIFALPGNGGISRDAECVPVKANNIYAVTEFAVKEKIDYAVVAPDEPLAIGMTDALEEKGIRCFGPGRLAARIESSKVFSKNIMKKYGIPTAAYETFSDHQKAAGYLKKDNIVFPAVIKADGLALGKGVIIASDLNEALAAINDIMQEKKFGDSGSSIVIEEYLKGPEITVLAFTDGNCVVPMISSMDHKRIYDGNRGPNTGGMGVIAPNPHYTEEIAKICEEKIFLPTIKALKAEGCKFKGCLYFGLMLTEKGPMVIEYNARFGDPEAQAVLSLLETDLLEIMEAVTDERLNEIEIRWKKNNERSFCCTACVILASGGYPSSYKTGFKISGLESGETSGVTIFHSGTEYRDGSFYTAAGRVLGVTALGPTPESALNSAYSAADTIKFENIYFRKDIGKY